MFWKFGKAGNHKSFSVNEGEDVKQRNFFTANKKQYTVLLTHQHCPQPCFGMNKRQQLILRKPHYLMPSIHAYSTLQSATHWDSGNSIDSYQKRTHLLP